MGIRAWQATRVEKSELSNVFVLQVCCRGNTEYRSSRRDGAGSNLLLGRLRQEDNEFKAGLSPIVRLCQKKKEQRDKREKEKAGEEWEKEKKEIKEGGRETEGGQMDRRKVHCGFACQRPLDRT